MQPIRIIEIPDCRMVSSGDGMFGEEPFISFSKWFSALPRGMYSKDFAADGSVPGKFVWLYLYEDGMDTAGFEVVDFTGGLYAVTTDIDMKTKWKPMQKALDKFLTVSGFARDKSRPDLGHIITPPAAHAVLGYHQMDYLTAIKAKQA